MRTEHFSTRFQNRYASSRIFAAVLAIAILVLPLRADDAAQWKLVEENWYRLEMAGQPAGWMGTFVHEQGDHLRSTNSMMFSIERGAVPITMEMNTVTIETRDGKPVSVHLRQVMGQQPLETTWEFTAEGVKETTQQGGRETVRERPRPEGEWLTPRAIKRFMQEKLKAGEEEIEYRTIDPSSGMRLITIRHTRTGEGSFQHGDRTVPVTIWRSTNDVIAPMHATEQYDENARMVYQEMNMGLGIMVMRLVDRATAKATDGAAAPEMLFESFVVPDKPIEDVMRKRTLTMRLRAKDGELPVLPTAGSQIAKMAEDNRSAVLTVNIDAPQPATDKELSDKTYVESSPLIDSGDEMIKSLARRAVREMKEDDRGDGMKKAEAMRAFVFRYITNKGMDTAFASASETARTRGGDCSEHSVLLAALLRAADIPARVASGLVYVDEFAGEKGIFGWHMWTQALVNGKWIDLDATLPVRHHAGHIITSVSSLADGMSSDQASLLMLMGNLKIEVLDKE